MSNIPAYNIDDLLVKYLLQETTDAEQQQVQHWLQQGDVNRQYFNHFMLIWNESRKLASASSIDENEAWENFLLKAQQRNGAKVISIKRHAKLPWVLAAAVFAGLIVFAVLFLQNKNEQKQMIMINSGKETITNRLTDGTIITLNRNSSISYNKVFTGNTRKVSLKGEAFFNVAPDKTKPFIISVNDVTIKVVGTSFNVKNINGNTEVIVESGIVEVQHKAKSISLRPKEKIMVNANETQLTRDSSNSKLYNYYRTKLFVCESTPLRELVAALNEAYDANIIIRDSKVANMRITVIFNEESLDKILSVVTTTLDIKAEKKDNTIFLR